MQQASKKTLVASLVAAALFSVSTGAIAKQSLEKPNVLVIIMDDLGTGQLDFTLDTLNKQAMEKRPVPPRYHGEYDKMVAAAEKAMPNVTEMARHGIKMTQAYVAHPVCGPSRAGIFTGRHPTSFGTYSNDDAVSGIPLDIKLLPELFQENGYRTANIGKWHNAKIVHKDRLDPSDRTRDYHDNQTPFPGEGYRPDQRGFDYSYSYYSSGAALYDTRSIFRNEERIAAPGYITHNLTKETVNFINNKNTQPFFISLAYSVPHIPLEQASPAQYMNRFDTGNLEADKYFASVNAADEGIGQIINTLKEQGTLENTLIFFLSDNGAVHESPMPMNGMDKGFKGQMYSGGLRVPFIVHWPKHISAGGKSDSLISALDILPTALNAAGIHIPDNMQVDGKNILPILKGETEKSPHEYLFWAGPGAKHYSEENESFWYDYWRWITYQSDKPAKNAHLEKLSKGAWAVRDQEWSLHFYDDGSNRVKLYNIANDPSESQNIAVKNPQKVAELRGAFYEWIKTKPKPIAWGQDRYQVLTESASM
ncbi:sulfatase-like hydrolase/transferase [Photobacterium japonica]|uniref:sulfatase family protein n=1 Tax=Photobacterium japonica TaxID=2910235 RepID=UPI003D127205